MVISEVGKLYLNGHYKVLN